MQELENEIQELNQFIKDLEGLPPDESKMRLLHTVHRASFASGHDTVLVFTQYADTMNYVVDQLSTVYGSRSCATPGAGGRRRIRRPMSGSRCRRRRRSSYSERARRSRSWLAPTPFLKGSTSKLVVASSTTTCRGTSCGSNSASVVSTESTASPSVEVTNLFYKDTIEEQIYQGISAGHDGFSWVVGPAQPVLAAIEDEIWKHEFGPDQDDQSPSLLPEAPLSKVIEGLRIEIEKAQAQAISLSTFESLEADPNAAKFVPVVTLEDIEETLLAVPSTREQFIEHPEVESAWMIEDEMGNKVPVTFDRGVLAENSPDIRLLTLGIRCSIWSSESWCGSGIRRRSCPSY